MPGRRCTTCAHPQLETINRLLGEGRLSERRIASQFGLIARSVNRHRAHCLGRQVLARLGRREEKLSADQIVKRLTALVHTADELLQKAIEADDLLAAGRLLKEARENLIACGKTLGMFAPAALIDARQVHVHNAQPNAFDGLSTVELREYIRLNGDPESRRIAGLPALPKTVDFADVRHHEQPHAGDETPETPSRASLDRTEAPPC